MNKIIFLICFLCTMVFADYSLLPFSIQNELWLMKQRKPLKLWNLTITPDIPSIFKDYVFEERKDKYWWSRYKLTISF